MLHITQLIYIKAGKEEVFHQFEDAVLPILPKYNGRLLLRLRPENNSIIAHTIEVPYEVHLVEFESEDDFQRFMLDEERKQFFHWKEESIKSSVLIKGERMN